MRADPKLKRRNQLWYVLEDGRAVSGFRHYWKVIPAFWAGLSQYCLFDVQIERLVLDVRASRANADQPGSLELEIRNDVLHDCAGAHRPFLGMLVIGIHVPIIQSLVARPEADLVVPSRVLRVCPPGEMEKTWQSLQMMPYIAEDDLESLQREVREHEPRLALTPGGDGLKVIRRLVSESPRHLKPGGHLLIEIGFGQHERVASLTDPRVWTLLDIRRDLQGIPRTVVLRLN